MDPLHCHPCLLFSVVVVVLDSPKNSEYTLRPPVSAITPYASTTNEKAANRIRQFRPCFGDNEQAANRIRRVAGTRIRVSDGGPTSARTSWKVIYIFQAGSTARSMKLNIDDSVQATPANHTRTISAA